MTAFPKELDALRGLLDSRLAALESAMADPSRHGSLEQIILDLARVATEEADATARRTFLDAQRDTQAAVNAARAEAQKALDTQQNAAAALSRERDAAREELASAQQAAKKAESAAAALRREMEQERAAAAAVQVELESAHRAIEEEQSSAAGVRRKLEEIEASSQGARRDIEAAQAEAAAARHQLDETRAAAAALEQQRATDRDAAAALRQQLDAAHGALKQEQELAARVRRELDEAQATIRTLEQERSGSAAAAREEIETLRQQLAETAAGLNGLAEAKTKIAGLEQELGSAHRDLQTRSQTLSGAQEALEAALKAAEQRADAAIADKQALFERLEAATAEVAAAETQSQTRYDELHAAAERQNRSLELALRDAETRAAALQLEVDEIRREARTAPSQAAESTSAPPPDAAEPAAGPKSPTRSAVRWAMRDDVEIQIDGSPGTLVDLSVSGAQIVATVALKPNRMVKITLPHGEGVACKGKIMWAKLEPGRGGVRYRAGVHFTSADQRAVEAFLKQMLPEA
jgi:DNA repair exonuclease SbcCD ATPase subunit